MQEPQAIDNHGSWFTYNDEEAASSLFDLCNLYPISDLGSPPQETAYQEPEPGTQSEDDFKHWLSELDSHCGSYWGEYLYSGDYSMNEAGWNEPVMKMDNLEQGEELYQSPTSYFVDDFSQHDSGYNTWSCHQNCEDEDEDSYTYIGEETATTNGYQSHEVGGICEGIFGYFPCLLQEQQKYKNMQQ